MVQGSFNLLHLMMCTSSACALNQDKDCDCLSASLTCVTVTLLLFVLAWTIAGSVWVWKSLDDWQDDHAVCNNALFISAMICLSLHYVVCLPVVCVCVVGIMLVTNDDSC